ncbi:hypothetical protein [Candidatus Venteria ishoeyi]|uniref:Uncharacterized protein n=1 Tax=Candidatus Venteria ishoeyi TaxID=1899563 RepID=A0A1H6FCN5_9GAMM|nr:hypothetical protein [Candidatus Venteria ishoeyi]SEH07827.1 Uncharacterised protein [Candidatus Venteria ishoeyi]SEH08060.1 Uncharacterised protein [Candidatus Venteria ishoeyi]
MKRATKVYSVAVLLAGSCFMASAHAERLWEDMAIRLSSGNYMWATLDRNSDCYDISVGSNDTNISGIGSNCSREIDGYWSIRACGGHAGSYRGGPSEVINKIVSMCN